MLAHFDPVHSTKNKRGAGYSNYNGKHVHSSIQLKTLNRRRRRSNDDCISCSEKAIQHFVKNKSCYCAKCGTRFMTELVKKNMADAGLHESIKLQQSTFACILHVQYHKMHSQYFMIIPGFQCLGCVPTTGHAVICKDHMHNQVHQHIGFRGDSENRGLRTNTTGTNIFVPNNGTFVSDYSGLVLVHRLPTFRT